MKGDVNNTTSSYVYFHTGLSDNIDIGGCIMALNQNAEITSTSLNQLTNTYTFYRLFDECEGLVSAEHLTMADNTTSYCYNSMFRGCTSLTTAPSLPATTLASYCYMGMFQNCTSLVIAPALSATTLASSCYTWMFDNCTALTSLTVYFTSISSGNISKWFNNVDTVGTLYCPTMATYSESDLSLPSGWTISKTAWVTWEQNISYDGVDVIVTGTTKALNASTNAAGATLT